MNRFLAVDPIRDSLKTFCMRGWISLFSLLSVMSAMALPSLNTVQPSAWAPGKPVEIRVNGDRLAGDLKLWTSFPAQSELIKAEGKQAVFRVTLPANTPIQVGMMRVHNAEGISVPWLVLVDPLEDVAPASTDRTKPQALAWPVAVAGTLPGQASHWFTLDAKAGERFTIEVYSERLAAKGDPMIRLFDPNGHEVDYADDDDVRGSDAALMHEARHTGTYLLELRDVQYRGGQSYRMRVGRFELWPDWILPPNTVTEKEPNDQAAQATPFNLGQTLFGHIEKAGARDHYRFTGVKDQWVQFRAHTRRQGSPAYIVLKLQDAAGKTIQTGGTDITKPVILRHKLPAGGVYTLQVEEYIRHGGPRHRYRLDTFAGQGGVVLKLKPGQDAKKKPLPLPDRLWAIPGQQLALTLQLERHQYEGGVEIQSSIGWPMEGASVPEKAKEQELKLSIPPTARPGELHHLELIGLANDIYVDPVQFTEAFRNPWGHMMLLPTLSVIPLAIIEPVNLQMNDARLAAGAKLKVRVNTRRAAEPVGQQPDRKPITLRLNNLPAGVTAPAKLEVPADKEFLEFELTATPEAKIGKMQITVSAQSQYRGTDWTRTSALVVLEVTPK